MLAVCRSLDLNTNFDTLRATGQKEEDAQSVFFERYTNECSLSICMRPWQHKPMRLAVWKGRSCTKCVLWEVYQWVFTFYLHAPCAAYADEAGCMESKKLHKVCSLRGISVSVHFLFDCRSRWYWLYVGALIWTQTLIHFERQDKRKKLHKVCSLRGISMSVHFLFDCRSRWGWLYVPQKHEEPWFEHNLWYRSSDRTKERSFTKCVLWEVYQWVFTFYLHAPCAAYEDEAGCLLRSSWKHEQPWFEHNLW